MFKSLAGIAGEMKIVNEMNKRYPDDVKIYNSLGLRFGGSGGDTMDTTTKMLSQEHLVQFRWREVKFMRQGVRYLTEVDPENRRAAIYYQTIPIGSGLTPMLQHFITPGLHSMALEVITRLNRNSYMGHAATIGQTPPEMRFFNGQMSMVYCFAAGIDYHGCRNISTNSDFLSGITEAAADGGARMGAALYDISHAKENKRSIESALKQMPKSKVIKEMKENDRQKLSRLVDEGGRIAQTPLTAEGRFAWRLGSDAGGMTKVAYITDYGHIVIETRAAESVPANRRNVVMELADRINAVFLGRMSHVILDLDSGQVAFRSGVRAKDGTDKVEPQVAANLILENAAFAGTVLSAVQAVSGGESADAVVARLSSALPDLSGSQGVVMAARFLFRA